MFTLIRYSSARRTKAIALGALPCQTVLTLNNGELLSHDVLTNVYVYMDISEVCKTSTVCRHWHSASRSNFLWNVLLVRYGKPTIAHFEQANEHISKRARLYKIIFQKNEPAKAQLAAAIAQTSRRSSCTFVVLWWYFIALDEKLRYEYEIGLYGIVAEEYNKLCTIDYVNIIHLPFTVRLHIVV